LSTIRRGSGGPYEERYGYERVVRVGPLAITAGCTAVVDGVVQATGDAGAQARIAFGIALAALAGVGVGPEFVVATRMSIIDTADSDAVGLAHHDALGSVRPAATMVVVAGLIDPRMLVEVELTAWVGGESSYERRPTGSAP
jgi:enamine deaminase RidA (YjgF/YER057c/UK114 family)